LLSSGIEREANLSEEGLILMAKVTDTKAHSIDIFMQANVRLPALGWGGILQLRLSGAYPCPLLSPGVASRSSINEEKQIEHLTPSYITMLQQQCAVLVERWPSAAAVADMLLPRRAADTSLWEAQFC
jgi:hypothetical protein